MDMNSYFHKIKSSSFIKSFTVLATGSLFAQLISLLISPITTRIFTTEELGIFTYILTAVNLFAPAINLRYELMIVPEKKEDNVIHLIQLSTIVCFIFSLLVSLGYFFYFLFNKEFSEYIFSVIFIFFLLLVNGLNNILISYNNRCKEYGIMTKVYVIKSTFQNIGLVISGFLSYKVFGMLLSQTVGMMFGFKKQSSTLIKRKEDLKKVNIKKLLQLAKDYKHQPLYSAPSIFANSFSYSFINIAIQSVFGASVLGLYSISYRILGMPLNFVSTNISKIYFEKASTEYRDFNQFRTTTMKTFFLLLMISIPMVIALAFFSPFVFSIIFGPSWKLAGVYVQILAPMYGIRLIASALSIGLQIKHSQVFEMKIQFTQMFLSIIAFLFTIYFDLTIYVYLMIISILFSVVYIYNIIVVFKISKGN